MNGAYRFQETGYFNGRWIEIDDTIQLDNYLLYDFSLNPGDTFWLDLKKPGAGIRLY